MIAASTRAVFLAARFTPIVTASVSPILGRRAVAWAPTGTLI